MKHMTLAEIAKACRGTYHGDGLLAAQEVSSVTIDSRKVQKGSLFIAIKGARVDGHDLIPQTVEAGALCALSEKNLGETAFPYIRVDSCRQALKDLAEHYRRSLDVKVVGISGSVGKTSTKEMIASVLSQKYCVLKTEGNFNNEVGLPLTVFNLREEHQVAVLEMGISDFGEMTRLARIARPDLCVITNIGCAHLEQLKNRDGILKAKTEMLAFMNPKGHIVFNGDDDKLSTFLPENGLRPVYFGLGEHCSFRAEHVEDQGLRGTDAEFVTPDSRFTAHISIPGSHMVHNAMAGTAVGRLLGLTDAEIRAGIEALVPLAGRNHLIETERFTIIDDCYNANPASMKASLDVLAKADTRTAAILGNMGELGENWKALHQEVGRYAAELGIHVLVCIGEMAEEIAEGARKVCKAQVSAGRDFGLESAAASDTESTAVYHYQTKADFLADAGALLKTGDSILVKASHMMEFPEIVEFLEKN
ncbi:MAG: UDP-N-acetylmuramoyl-tripeptide--D-alanyl-D-alanine ligase [Schaedlerella sp.]|uniref:UDP-N-acetylmuramoyl-tripeptide--D-alanyl-D- alanine ligase n=1 Tax=Schaedlerella sp. TaxID=2676057 RepID=UPI0035277DDC